MVYVQGEGVVLEEPTVVAVSLNNSKVVAVGKEAQSMLGRTPGNIKASRPMRDGVIADYAVTEAMLMYFLKRVGALNPFFRPEVLISVPVGVTQVERRAVVDATLAAGARKAYLINEPVAAAIGAGVPIMEPSGNMIVDMGGGTAEGAIISLGGVVVSKSVRVAGNKIDEAIARYMRKKHSVVVGDATAEQIKIKIGSALPLAKMEKMEISGRHSVTGLPVQVEIDSSEVAVAIAESLDKIAAMIKSVLEEVLPELSSDVIERGIVLSGGSALLRNLDRYLTEKTGVPVFVAEDPLRCVINGTGIVLEDMVQYADVLTRA